MNRSAGVALSRFHESAILGNSRFRFAPVAVANHVTLRPEFMLSVDWTGQYGLDIDYRGAVQRLQGSHPQACRLGSFQHLHAV